MNQIAFDTLEYSKILQNAGVPQEQADAFAAAQKIALAQVVDNAELATKKDLLGLELRLENKFAALDNKINANFTQLDNKININFAHLDNKINVSHHSLVKWFMGTTLTMLAVMIAGMGIIIAFMPR